MAYPFSSFPDEAGVTVPVALARGPASNCVWSIGNGGLTLSPLFDIVDERKRNAGGGVLAVGASNCADTETKSNAFEKPMKLWSQEQSRMATRQCSQTTIGCGASIPQPSCFKLESLILAQNERWRQA
jgi:hypothetical protein